MPTAVARADKVSYYSSFGAKSFRHCKTRTISITSEAAPVLAEWKKPNVIKQAPPPLRPPLKNGAHNGTCIKRSLPLEKRVRDNHSAEVVPGNSACPLCDDVLCQSFHSELLTPIAREVLRYLILPNPSQRLMEFHGVGPREFKLIEHVVGETDRILTKPRLSYRYNKRLLTVDMPSILHKRSFDYLKDVIAAYILFLPYDRELISPILHMNYPLKLTDQLVTPDLTMTLTAVDGAPQVVIVPSVGECAVSQNRAHVFDKVENEIFAHPEAVLAIIVLVHEAISYESPQDISTASMLLRNGTDNPEPLSLHDFLQLRSTPRSFNQPIRIADHDWAHLESVEYFVWVKGDNQERIDVRNTNPQFMAYGTLGPVLQMDAVTAMLQRGMNKVRDSMVNFSRMLDNTWDFSALEEAEVRVPLNWNLGAKLVMTTADLTAHQRYEAWHEVRFKGAKCTEQNNDPSYCPSESDNNSSESATPRVRSRCIPRARLCKRLSTSQPPPHKSKKTKGKTRRTGL